MLRVVAFPFIIKEFTLPTELSSLTIFNHFSANVQSYWLKCLFHAQPTSILNISIRTIHFPLGRICFVVFCIRSSFAISDGFTTDFSILISRKFIFDILSLRLEIEFYVSNWMFATGKNQSYTLRKRQSIYAHLYFLIRHFLNPFVIEKYRAKLI